MNHKQFRIAEDVLVWAEPGGPIMIKAIDGRDPVEMTEDDARVLADVLLQLADEIAD